MKAILYIFTLLTCNLNAEDTSDSAYLQFAVSANDMSAVVETEDDKFAQFEKPLTPDATLKLGNTYQMVIGKAMPIDKNGKIENPIGLVISKMDSSELTLSDFTNALGEKIESGGVYVISILATEIEPIPKQSVSQLIVAIAEDGKEVPMPDYEEIAKSLE